MFRAAVCGALLAVGCGGRTTGGGGASGSGSGVFSGAVDIGSGNSGVTGMAGASAGVTSGTVAGTGFNPGQPTGCVGDYIVTCPLGMSCQGAGTCVPCAIGMTPCFLGNNGTCVEAESDPNNCGACGVMCPSGTCRGGNCVPVGDQLDSSTDGAAGAATDTGTPPSCGPGGPGMTNCGPGGSGTESCCTSLEVTGGTCYRTYTNDGSGPGGEADPAAVSGFRLDKYLVTVGRFRQFVNATVPPDAGWFPPPGSGKHAHLNGGLGLVNVGDDAGVGYEPGWRASDDANVAPTEANLTTACESSVSATWTPLASGNENLPMNCVNWYEAYAFCIWDDGFLPSEAEWEYVASGGSEQRAYPWGATAPGTTNQYAIYGGTTSNCYYPDGGTCTGVPNIAPVGTPTLGASLFGQLDLAGNVNEWTLDWYVPYVDPCIDCAFLSGTSERAYRAGDFYDGLSLLHPETRDGDPPTIRLATVGIRCARTP